MKNSFQASHDLLWDLSKANLPHRFFWTFFTLDLAIVVLDLIFNYAHPINSIPLRRLFNIAREDGIGTYVGSFQTLCAGLALQLLWLQAKLTASPKSTTQGWGFLTGFFYYMAFDDVSGFHERIGAMAESLSGRFKTLSSPLGIFPSYEWQVIFGPLLLFTLIVMIKLFNREVKNQRHRYLLLAAMTCYIFAVLYDFLEGVNGLFDLIAEYLVVKRYTVSHFLKVTEEFLELLGGTFFLTAFTEILVSKTRALKITFQPS